MIYESTRISFCPRVVADPYLVRFEIIARVVIVEVSQSL